MADAGRLREEWGNRRSAEDYAYYEEVVRRLEGAVGPWLSIADCYALTDVLHHNLLVCEDGFVIGDKNDGLQSEMGGYMAAVVAWCFLDAKNESYWTRRRIRKWGPTLLKSQVILGAGTPDRAIRAEKLLTELRSKQGVRAKPIDGD